MMMGLIGLVINVCESLNIFEGLLKMASSISAALGFPSHESHETEHERIERRVLIFDFVHVSLFFLSIFYVLIVIITFWLFRHTWNRWSQYEEGSYEQTITRHRVLQERKRNMNKFALLFNWYFWYKYYSNGRRLTYFAIKQRFLKVHHLEQKYGFVCFTILILLICSFHMYLRDSLLHIFTELIEVDWKVLIGVWVAFLLNYIRIKIVSIDTGGGGVYTFIGIFGGLSLILSFIMFCGCRIGLT
jgi:magnesium-transporting ATPase (P-type)